MNPLKPTLGRIVIYTSKIDNGAGLEVRSPAMVIRTKDTCVPEVFDRWGPSPDALAAVSASEAGTAARPTLAKDAKPVLANDTTVDLIVFGLGKTYREYNVEQGNDLGQWDWPPRGD